MRNNCGHAWEPIPNWNGRYCCTWCRALAYKNLINGGARGRPSALSVYICARSNCHEPAIQTKPQRCLEHLDTSRRDRKSVASSRIESSSLNTEACFPPTAGHAREES